MDHAPGSPSKYMTTIYNDFCIKMIFLDFLKVKKIMKICFKTHRIAPLNFFFRGSMSPNPPSKRKPPPPNNSWPPLANPAYVHELLLRNLFENPLWQTIDCV